MLLFLRPRKFPQFLQLPLEEDCGKMLVIVWEQVRQRDGRTEGYMRSSMISEGVFKV